MLIKSFEFGAILEFEKKKQRNKRWSKHFDGFDRLVGCRGRYKCVIRTLEGH